MFGRLLGKRVKDCKRGGALSLVLAICLTLLPVCLFAEEEMLAEWDAETKTLTIANAAKIDADVLAAMEIQTSDGAAVPYAEIQSKVESLVLEDVTAIEGRGLFAKLTQLKHVSAAGADTIGEYTFNGCRQLASAVITNVHTIEQYAFSDCRKLANIEITGRGKESGSYIGEYAFRSCGADVSAEAGEEACIAIQDIGIIEGYACIYGGWTKAKFWRIGSIGHIIPGQFGGGMAFARSKLTEVTVEDVGTVSGSTFAYCYQLKTARVSSTGLIDEDAFAGCSALEAVFLSGVGMIDGDAFSSCLELKTLEGIDENTKLGYINRDRSDLFDLIPGLTERVEKIMKGRFFLNSATEIERLKAEQGWFDTKPGKENRWSSYKGDTQIFEQARWKQGTDSTVAQVQVQAYSTFQKQMDFIFVLDVSGSMIYIGADGDMNAKYYDLYSKVQDITAVLLSRGEDYDCQAAFITFCGTTAQSNGEFYSDITAAKAHLADLPTPSGNTPYDAAMSKAKELATQHAATGRNTAVVLISDGYPEPWSTLEPAIATAAEIKDAGVPIYGVIQCIGDDYRPYAQYAMENICSDQLYFDSDDTKGFSDAVNQAVNAAYGYYSLSLPIGHDFDGATVENITVSGEGGTAVYDAESNSIQWRITGTPFAVHTLSFEVALKQGENGYPYGTFDTNSQDAVLRNAAGETVNQAETPKLRRVRDRLLTTSIDHGGSITESGVYPEGEEITIRFAPAEGYAVKTVTLDGQLMPKDWDGQIVMDRDHEVIVATVRAGGDIQPTGDESTVMLLGALLAAALAVCAAVGKRRAVRK